MTYALVDGGQATPSSKCRLRARALFFKKVSVSIASMQILKTNDSLLIDFIKGIPASTWDGVEKMGNWNTFNYNIFIRSLLTNWSLSTCCERIPDVVLYTRASWDVVLDLAYGVDATCAWVGIYAFVPLACFV